jgi:GT2 family glycosyltransferase
MPEVSVMICTYNRSDMLSVALTALIVGTDIKPDEIVVVNGGGSEADDVVRSFEERAAACGTHLVLVRTVNINLATSRNIGLRACTGSIVAMTDDDAEVYPDWVCLLKEVHRQHPEAGAVGGSIVGARSSHQFVSRISDIVTFPVPERPAYVRTLAGVNVSYKREALEKVGFQDESLFRGEDVDFNWRIRNAGYEVYFDPAIKVRHNHRATLSKLICQHYMYGRGYFLVRDKWRDMYCVYPHGLRSFKDLVKVVHFIVAAIYEPFVYAAKMDRWTDKVLCVPILFFNQCAWRGGMILQMILGRNR